MAAQLLRTEQLIWLSRSRDYLGEHFDKKISLELAAREACLSPFHFQRLFRKAYGESPHEFLTRRRMERATQLLRTSDVSVSDVCLEIGYQSLGTFSATFARKTGYAPTEFRRVFSAPDIWKLKVVPACFRF